MSNQKLFLMSIVCDSFLLFYWQADCLYYLWVFLIQKITKRTYEPGDGSPGFFTASFKKKTNRPID